MFSEIAVVTVSEWNTDKTYTSGKPVLLKCIAGKSVDKSILPGSLAEKAGFKLNRTYLVNITEKPVTDENRESYELYGPDFNFIILSELSGIDIIKSCKELGQPVTVPVAKSKKATRFEDEGEEEIFDEKPKAKAKTKME